VRRWFLPAAVFATASLFAASNAAAQSTLVSVNIVDDPRPQDKWGYAPGSRRVPVGTWVTWSNSGYEAHTVTALDGSFDSGELNPSEGFSWYFDQDGTYQYVCALHTWMTGKVIVGTGVAPDPPPDANAE
jgi:plastocyanin